MSDLSEAMFKAGMQAWENEIGTEEDRDFRAFLAAALRVQHDAGLTYCARGDAGRQLAFDSLADEIELVEHPAQCTCEYPYPREIWGGHHPNCAGEHPAEDGTR